MKILITGAAGLIGHFLSQEYSKLGHAVVGVDNFSNSYPELVKYNDNFTLFEADASDLDAMNYYCDGVDIIFHTACLPYEGFSNISPYAVSKSVFNPTVAIATAAANHKVKRIYNFSSMARYGNNPNLPFTEEMKPTPSDPYGAAKVAAEDILNVMSDIYGFEVCHLVPHNVFGLGSRWNDPYRGVLYIFINQALQELDITIFGDGKQKRSFSFVHDAFSFTSKLLNCDIKNKEVFNVGPDEPATYLTINELAEIVIQETGSRSLIQRGIPKPNEVKYAWCSSDKIRKKFDWKSECNTSLDIKEEIKKMIDYVKIQGTKPFLYNHPIEINRLCPDNWKK